MPWSFADILIATASKMRSLIDHLSLKALQMLSFLILIQTNN